MGDYLLMTAIAAGLLMVGVSLVQRALEAELSVAQRAMIAIACACVWPIPKVGGVLAILLCAGLLKTVGKAKNFWIALLVSFIMFSAVIFMVFFLVFGGVIAISAWGI